MPEIVPSHPVGSIRARGFDRVHYSDGTCIDLQPGEGKQLAAALEDVIVRGVWLTSIYGGRSFVVLARVDLIDEFTAERLELIDRDDWLYKEADRTNDLTGGP